MILDPRGYSVIEWTDSLNDSLTQFGPVPRLDDEDDWKEWAFIVCGLPGISRQHPPTPDSYDEWMDWADAFNQAVKFDG